MKSLVAAALLLLTGTAHGADLAGTLARQGQFSKLLEAVKAAELDGLLRNPGPYTLFAPTDAAFAALRPDKVAALMRPENKAELARLLGYHLIVGRVEAKDWGDRKVAVKSSIGMPLTITGGQGSAMVNDARASRTDLAADNGTIHVVDQVLLPPTPIAPRT